MKEVILFDAEDSDQTLTVRFDESENKLTLECDDGTYQDVWLDQFVIALKKLGALTNGKAK